MKDLDISPINKKNRYLFFFNAIINSGEHYENNRYKRS
jgi:hypothetical protein